MALINVTELLHDPDFIDQIKLVTRKPSVNSLGENTLEEISIDTIGSVQPASGHAIQRLPEALRVANISSFWFKGKIIASEPGKYSSILVFKGARFQVQTVMDWSNWGEGWSEGTCVAEVPAP
jgi:hypothetical protein